MKKLISLLIVILIFIIHKFKKNTTMENKIKEGAQPTVDDAIEKMSPLTTEISNSIDDLTALINKHRDAISDIYLKTLSIPNVVFTLIITNTYFREQIVSSWYLPFLFKSVIISYCLLITFTILSLYVTNFFYAKHKATLSSISGELNESIESKKIPTKEMQVRAKKILMDYPVKWGITLIRFLVATAGIINIISLIAFIITISITVTNNKGNSMTKTQNEQKIRIPGQQPTPGRNPGEKSTPSRRIPEQKPINESNDPRKPSKPIPIIDEGNKR